MPNMNLTPCRLRLLATRVAPSTSAMSSSCQGRTFKSPPRSPSPADGGTERRPPVSSLACRDPDDTALGRLSATRKTAVPSDAGDDLGPLLQHFRMAMADVDPEVVVAGGAQFADPLAQ